MTDRAPPRLVILESPYAGNIDVHLSYARACLRDSLQRNEAPRVPPAIHPAGRSRRFKPARTRARHCRRPRLVVSRPRFHRLHRRRNHHGYPLHAPLITTSGHTVLGSGLPRPTASSPA
jgi:hypothetical protein